MRTLIFIILFVSILATHGVQGQSCGANGTPDGMFCNCYGGYSPDYTQSNIGNCGISVPGCSLVDGDDENTSGNQAPSFSNPSTPVKFEGDSLVITFRQPVTSVGWQRTTTNIKFHVGHSTGTPVSTCGYPGKYWKKVAQTSCYDEYTLRMPWGKYDTCGFQKVATSSYLIYTTTAEFTYKLKSSGGVEREMVNLFHLNIRLARQKTVAASLALALDSTEDAVVSSVIVRSSVYDLLARRTMVVIQTQTTWPYKIASSITTPSAAGPTYVQSPTPRDVVVTPDYLTPDNCEQTPGSVCIQQFVVRINSTSDTCTDVGGEYVFNTQLVCSDVGTCDLADGPDITLVLDEIDCTPSFVNSTQYATNALIAFSDSAFTSPATDFETGDNSYWAFAVIDPSVTIDSVKLSSVKLSSVSDDSIVDELYNPTDNIDELLDVVNADSGVVYPPGTAAVVSFTVPLNRGVLLNTLQDLSPGDAAEALSLEVVVDIAYHGNQRKRLVGVVRAHSNNQAASISSFVVRSSVAGGASTTNQNDGSTAKSMCTDSNSISCAALTLVWKALGVVGL